MTQESIWEREYKSGKLVTFGEKPNADVVDFRRYLRKEADFDLVDKKALDLGSGAGKNSIYLAEHGTKVIGYEIADTALALAKKRAIEAGLTADEAHFEKRDIGSPYPLADRSIDLALDFMSTNSLDEKGRAICIAETARVLVPKGWLFVRALCKEGDQNAKNLLKLHPGREYDTYIMPDLGLVERVWSKEDFSAAYEPFFDIVHLEKKEAYSQIAGRSFKRNFWLAYLQKKG